MAVDTGRSHPIVSLTILIINQLLAGVGVASGIAVGGLLAQEMTDTVALAGLAQTSSVLGAGIVAIPLARLAVLKGRHVALASGYALSLVGALLVVVSAQISSAPVLFLGMMCFGAASAAGLQARFAATEIARPGFEARAMSLVLWATTLGSVAGPNLAEWGNQVGQAWGLAPLVGPFALSAIAFAVSTLLVGFMLRLPAAGSLEDETGDAKADAVDTHAEAAPRIRALAALKIAVRDPRALAAILAIVGSHTVMVGVMVMTPVHMHDHGLSLGLVGLVISIHIFGMYGASPLVGWLVDRIGELRVIVVGIVVLFAATIVGAFAADDSIVQISIALGLLGLGWSAGLIGGSTLLTRAVSREIRVPLQGATDAVMNLGAAAAAALSGVILAAGGFAAVNLAAACVLIPVVVYVLRARRTVRA